MKTKESSEMRPQDMLLESDPTRLIRPGNLNLGLDRARNVMRAPPELIRIAAEAQLVGVVALLSGLRAAPSHFMRRLDWSHNEVQSAHKILVSQLEGIMPERILRPPPPPKVAFGANGGRPLTEDQPSTSQTEQKEPVDDHGNAD